MIGIPRGRPYRLMLVDDHAVVRAGYESFLAADPGLSVSDQAASAEQAYAALLAAERIERLPDLLIVDISLGSRSGLDLIERCARRFPTIQCLVFSMHEDARTIEHALAAGARGYVSKSSRPQTIFEAIASIRAGRVYLDPQLHAVLDARGSRSGAFDSLTRREFEVLSRLVQGQSAESIAEALCLSPKTVANHLSATRGKLGASNDFQLFRLAVEHGLASG